MTRSLKVDQLTDALNAVPGVITTFSDAVPSSIISTTSSSFENIPLDVNPITGVIPVAGKYLFMLSGAHYAAGTLDAYYEVVIDAGTGDEKIIGNSDSWHQRINTVSVQQQYFYTDTVELTAGSHTFAIKWKTSTSTLSMSTSSWCKLIAQLVSGSGAGGVIVTEKTDDQQRSGTGATPTEVTQLQLAITTTADEYVDLRFIGRTSTSATPDTPEVYLKIDSGSWIMMSQFTGNTGWACNSAWSAMAQFAAGDHIVRIGIKCFNSTAWTLCVGGAGLGVPVSRFQAIQYRGGLVPIEKDGVAIVDTPRSFNFVGDNFSVTNVNGRATIANNGVAEGKNIGIRQMNAYDDISSESFVSVEDSSGVVNLSVNCLEGESVTIKGVFSFAVTVSSSAFVLGIGKNGSNPDEKSMGRFSIATGTYYSMGFSFEFEGLSSGVNTFALMAKRTSGSGTLRVYGGGTGIPDTYMKYVQYRGGYVQPDNVPILQYNSASVVDIAKAPGAAAELSVILNDGMRYRHTGTLTVDLTVSGRGGLDTGSEAVSTPYYIYLVPDVAGTGLSAVASASDPDTGPTGFSVWKYIGAILNINTGDIKPFVQVGNTVNLSGYAGGYSATTVSAFGWTALNLSAFLPATAKTVELFMSIQTNSGVWGNYYAGGKSGYDDMVQSTEGDDTKTASFVSGITTPQTVYHQLTFGAGSTANQLKLYVSGWVDGYLSGGDSQAQAACQPDTKSPQGTWATSTTVAFAARLGQPSLTRLTLQDGKQRTMTALTWASANGVADLGYDEAGSQGTDKWLYFYCVPSSGDDGVLTVRASDNPPSVGPTGYSNWKLAWADYNDDVNGLLKVYQIGNVFHFEGKMVELGSSEVQDSVPLRRDLVYCPLSAGAVTLFCYVQTSSNGYLNIYTDTGSGSYGSLCISASQNVAWTFSIVIGSVPLPVPGSIYHKRYSAGTYGSNSHLACCGWEDNWISA